MEIWEWIIFLPILFLFGIPLATAMLLLAPCLPGLSLAVTSSQPKKLLSRRIAFGLYFVLLLLAIVFPGLRIDDWSSGENLSAGGCVQLTFFGGSVSDLANEVTKKEFWQIEDSGDTISLAVQIVIFLLFAFFWAFIWGIMFGWANERFYNFLIRRGWKKAQPVAQAD
jgi:hypothetical protein